MKNVVAAMLSSALLACGCAFAGEKTENFDRDPNWDGHNNRPTAEPATVKQNFGFASTSHAGGKPGEMGGHICAAGEAAYYAKVIPAATFDSELSASGTLACPDGGFNILVGFFNANTTNEWRTPNTIVLRINGRGDHFISYIEYLTQKWRIGSLGGHGFASVDVPGTGKKESPGFKQGGSVHKWSLKYDPKANDGKGVIYATIDDQTAECPLDPAYRADGASFNRFGILNVLKSYDGGGEIYFDDLTINGEKESFDNDPKWEGKNNRATYQSQFVRPRWDVGFAPSNIAGGSGKGEIGGRTFRGDCRDPDRMAYYGDRLENLSLEKPFKASGKIAMTQGVSDSSTLFGFFNSRDSIEVSNRQDSGLPKSFLGFLVEGPSSEGFFFYPVYRTRGDVEGHNARDREPLIIMPDSRTHDWSLQYDPAGGGGNGRITLSLDGRSITCDLQPGVKASGTLYDRFGFITSWIDGNAQHVYFDDLTYTVSQ
jgi:hypothetical protein